MTTREGRLRGRDLALAVGAAALLLVVVLAASIRHDAHCERGGEEDAETAASLARQALAARLLSAEQEALENQLLVKRVAGLVAEERVEAASFSDLYADADLLARAVDAAFSEDLAAAAAPSTGWAAAESWAAAPEENWAAPEQDWAAAEPEAEVDDCAPTRRGPRRRRRARGRRRRGPRALRRAARGPRRRARRVLGDRARGGPPSGGTRGCDGTG